MLAKYKPLIMYMCANQLACDVAKANIIVLFNVHIFHLASITSCPYLDYNINLSKWFILKHLYIVDFVKVVKLIHTLEEKHVFSTVLCD
jgi:hypothetical protein